MAVILQLSATRKRPSQQLCQRLQVLNRTTATVVSPIVSYIVKYSEVHYINIYIYICRGIHPCLSMQLQAPNKDR
mgnify:CR=1 FL=1